MRYEIYSSMLQTNIPMKYSELSNSSFYIIIKKISFIIITNSSLIIIKILCLNSWQGLINKNIKMKIFTWLLINIVSIKAKPQILKRFIDLGFCTKK